MSKTHPSTQGFIYAFQESVCQRLSANLLSCSQYSIHRRVLLLENGEYCNTESAAIAPRVRSIDTLRRTTFYSRQGKLSFSFLPYGQHGAFYCAHDKDRSPAAATCTQHSDVLARRYTAERLLSPPPSLLLPSSPFPAPPPPLSLYFFSCNSLTY